MAILKQMRKSRKSRKQRRIEKIEKRKQRTILKQQRKAEQEKKFHAVKEDDYAPNISILDVIEELINDLPTTRYFKSTGFVDFTDSKYNLLSIFYDTVSEYEENGHINDLLNHYTSNFNKIQEKCNVIKWDSQVEYVNAAFGVLGIILAYRFLSKEESDNLDIYASGIMG